MQCFSLLLQMGITLVHIILLITVLSALAGELAAQSLPIKSIEKVRETTPADPTLLRSDDEDFRILPKPVEVITWGIGLFANGKASYNLSALSGATSAPSNPTAFLPSFYLEFVDMRNDSNFNTRARGLDIRPVFEYGITITAPVLANVFGRNIGVNLDLFLATYRFGMQYYMTNIIKQDLETFRKSLVPTEYDDNIFPKFYFTFHYLNIAPTLNISGFLLGANIGIPVPNMNATLSVPTARALGMASRLETIAPEKLRLVIEPRIGLTAPIITSRTGTLNFLATLSWMPAAFAPLTAGDSLTIRRSNTVLQEGIDVWRRRSGSAGIVKELNTNFLLSPLSISFGLSYVFNFGNAALIDAFERESYVNDSLRAVYAGVSRSLDSLRLRSIGLADKLVNDIVAQSRLRDTIAQKQKEYELTALRHRQDSIRKAHEREIYIAKEELGVLQMQKKGLESQKRDLETKNKQKDASLIAKARELSEKQRTIDEKQRALETAMKKVFEANVGAVVGMNDDGSEVIDNPTLRVEEFRATTTKTLLPVVYFDQNSAVIPSRYHQVQSASRETYKLPQDPTTPCFRLHADLLNIIAKRLLQASNVTLTLTGIQQTNETDPTLAARRAEAVASYLMNTWKIASNRLIRETRRSVEQNADGGETQANAPEGRAVLLSSADASICAPFTLPMIVRTATPPVIAIGLNIASGAGIKQWQLGIRQMVDNEEIELKDTTAKTLVPRYVWHVNNEQTSLPRCAGALTLILEATDVTNTKAPEAPIKEMKVEYITVAQKQASGNNDNTVSFTELLFDASVADLRPQCRRVFDDLKRSITPDAQVQITVYNPRNRSGSASDIAQMLGVDAGKAIMRNLAVSRNTAQTGEATAYDNSIVIRTEARSKSAE
jgi:hypothetical protein